MKTIAALLAVAFALGLPAIGAGASPTHTKHKTHRKHHTTRRHHVTHTSHVTSTHHSMPAHPKNEVTKLEKDRKEDHTVRQVTPDPKKSPGKHADNLSKNVNHEVNRESKDINHFFQGKKK